jgi:hypothetical protein
MRYVIMAVVALCLFGAFHHMMKVDQRNMCNQNPDYDMCADQSLYK